MSEQRYSTSDLLIAAHAAIRARDFEAVAAFVGLLAVQDPQAAQDVLDIVAFAKAIQA